MTPEPNEAQPGVDRPRGDRAAEQWTDDRTYELLANARRRECVRHLRNRADGDGVPVRELADAVADALADGDAAGDRLRRSVYTSLSQHHLDRLDRCDVVDYDRDGRLVARGSNFGTVARASIDAESGPRPMGLLPCWTSALTAAILLLSAVAYPALATPPVLVAAALNLLPVGLFVRTRFGGVRARFGGVRTRFEGGR
ncbi:DUF7344 domain-containing protein [Halorussus sp. AFM4]|uniref:DUF7344 domain-containing protein n=1 Tax=Halorussus sp. AFM4 TaxID=3421651 RepID=UPI003EB9FE01